MRTFTRKSEVERVVESVGDSLSGLSDGLRTSRLLKVGLIAGGLLGLTAGSARISSIRRSEGQDSKSHQSHA